MSRLLFKSLTSLSRTNLLFRVKSIRLSSNSNDKPIWQDPWEHALPKKEATYTEFEEVPVDFKIVERLMGSDKIPDPPTSQEVTPSGWRPPREPVPDLPYYIRRNRFHLPALYLSRQRDQLNPATMQFEYKELVTLKGVYGDCFACEADLKQFLEAKLGHPVATFVNELQGRIVICNADRADVEEFVFGQGF